MLIRWLEFDSGPGPQTEDAIERGFCGPGPVDDQFGRSDSIDPDLVGDIADGVGGHGADQPRRHMVRTTLDTFGMAVAALALGSATIAGQHAHSAPAGAAGSNPAHIHIGHVMTMWKDTPNTQGFLPVAVADANVAATHAGLMQKSPDNLDVMKLHAGHVLHALDPTLEAKGPGSGYGVKRAAAGALQHIELAAKSEGASQNVQTHAGHVSESLSDVIAWTDQAIATAQKIRAATSASEAAALVTELIAQTSSIAHGMDANKDGSIGWQTGEGGLAQAQTHMDLMMKGEGL